MSCHLSGLWILSPHSSCWSGRIPSVPKQGIWEFWKPLRSSLCRALPDLQAQGQEGALLSPCSQGKGNVLLPGTGEKPPMEAMPMECRAVALGVGAAHGTGRSREKRNIITDSMELFRLGKTSKITKSTFCLNAPCPLKLPSCSFCEHFQRC